MRKTLYFISICTFILGSFFIFKGYDKKMNYQKPKLYSNSYVGGDAYNYIINSNYFTGYNVLGIGCYIITVISLTGATIVQILDDKLEESKRFYEYIYKHPIFSSSGEKSEIGAKQNNGKFSVNDWGPLPNIPYENKDHNQNQTVNKNGPEVYTDPNAYGSGFNTSQTQMPQYYSNTPQQVSNDQWSRSFVQNPPSNQPTNNNFYMQSFNNPTTFTPKDNNSDS